MMKFRFCLTLLLLSVTIPGFSQTPLSRPKLVVGITVDQMRWDYLYRYYDRYEADGFKRLLREGFSCEHTNIDYIPTYTAVGHTTIYTGSVPAVHGIAGNDFIIQATGQRMYCTDDSTVQTVGSTSVAGRMSPRNMLTTTITDELKLATNFRAKVIGISLKDRGGILPAGHSADAAYWFDDASGNWISSTYYMDELPDWVKGFNEQKLPEKYLKQDWNTLYPVETYAQSTDDNSPFEGAFRGAGAPVFPVKTSEIMKTAGLGVIRSTPYGNSITLDLAREAIEQEGLGENEQGITDFLAVSLSSPDYIGHQFGPNSVEAEDNYLRLDRELGAFFSFLDEKLGKGNYTVFLTADHGAAHVPDFLIRHKIPAGLWPDKQILKDLNSLLEQEYGQADLVLSLLNNQVHLNNKLLAEGRLDEDAVKKTVRTFLEKQEGVAFVVEMDQAARAGIPAVFRERIVNGYNRRRSGAIQIILDPAWFGGNRPTGTTHGNWNPYDAHIPLLWMGWGIRQGQTNRPVNMTDITPTLAALLHLQEPNGCIGEPVTEVISEPAN